MTVMPVDSHSGTNLSRFIMFCDIRYIAGVRLCFVAAFCIATMGDGHVRPAANQFSVSVTQKSGSECVMIACVSVMTTFSSIVNFMLFCSKC